MRTRIKICGLTRREDLGYAAALGVDAVGLVFQAKSPRRLEASVARELLHRRPAFLSVVALFMDAGRDEVRRVLDEVPVEFIQFHGAESPDFCASFGVPYIKAIPMGSVDDVASYADGYVSTASAFVLDSHCVGSIGGTGRVFDWTALPDALHLPIVLAGGLTPDNVADGMRLVCPQAVDVASGVESEKGIKDHRLMRAFVSAVQAVDREMENGQTS